MCLISTHKKWLKGGLFPFTAKIKIIIIKIENKNNILLKT
jgi:hypothetical protein